MKLKGHSKITKLKYREKTQKHRTEGKEHVQKGLIFLCCWSLGRKRENENGTEKYLKRHQLRIF